MEFKLQRKNENKEIKIAKKSGTLYLSNTFTLIQHFPVTSQLCIQSCFDKLKSIQQEFQLHFHYTTDGTEVN